MRSALMLNPKPIVIRGPSGLGDAIYLRPIVDYLARTVPVIVLSNWPDVFRDAGVEVRPFDRATAKTDLVAHYVHGKDNPATNQWQDMCSSARLATTISPHFNWTVTNHALIEDLRARAAGRKIVLVHGGRTPMDRTDGFGASLLPDKPAFDAVLDTLSSAFLVRIGKKCKMGEVYPLRCELDLQEKTTVSDLLDIGASCDGWVAQCSLAIPLAEAFGKPLLCVWSARGMRDAKFYVRSITPQKVLSGSASRFVVDDWPVEKIRAAALEFAGMFGGGMRA